MSFNPQALSENSLKSFVDRLVKSNRQSGQSPQKRTACQETVAHMLGFTSWHVAITAVREPSKAKKSHPWESAPPAPSVWDKVHLDKLLEWVERRGRGGLTLDSRDGARVYGFGNQAKRENRFSNSENIENGVIATHQIEELFSSLVPGAPEFPKEYASFPYVSPSGRRFVMNCIRFTSYPDGDMKNVLHSVEMSFHLLPAHTPDLANLHLPSPLKWLLAQPPRAGVNLLIAGSMAPDREEVLSGLALDVAKRHKGKVILFEGTLHASVVPAQSGLTHVLLQERNNLPLHKQIAQEIMTAHLNGYDRIFVNINGGGEEMLAAVNDAASQGACVYIRLHHECLLGGLNRLFTGKDQDPIDTAVRRFLNLAIAMRQVEDNQGDLVSIYEYTPVSDIDRSLSTPQFIRRLYDKSAGLAGGIGFEHDLQDKAAQGLVPASLVGEFIKNRDGYHSIMTENGCMASKPC